MRHLSRFLSIFEVAHPEFGESGRQKWGIHPVFCSDFEAAHLKFEGGGRTFFQPLRATRSDYGQNAVFWRLARKCQSPITRQNVDSWNLSVNGKYDAAIFSKFKKSIAIGHPGFYQKHVASKDLVRITLIISIFKEIMQQKKGAYVSSQSLVYTCTNFDVFVDIIL